jgi:hypothetical protein
MRNYARFSTSLGLLASICAITLILHSPLSAQKFEAAHTYPVAANIEEAAVGDFNNDGFDDVAITSNSNSGAGSVSLLIAGPSGLAKPVSYATNGTVAGIAVGDFNHDGKLDLATASSRGVNILLGNGDGTFQTAVLYPTTYYMQALVVGDFNGDGILDVIVTGQSVVYLLAGKGDGTFQAPVSIENPDNTYSALAAADLNGDGKLDFVGISSGNVTVFLATGGGSFQTPVNYPVGTYPSGLVIADFNGDGKPDVAVSECMVPLHQTQCTPHGSVAVLLGNGDGTLQAAKTKVNSTDESARNLVAADFNGDGKIDLAVDCQGGSDVSLLFGKGDGTFGPAQNWAAGAGASYLVTGDFNHDGILDLIALNPGNQTISLLLGGKGGKFVAARDYEVQAQPRALAAGDFNEDGVMDIVVADNVPFAVNVLLGNKGGGFAAPVSYTISSGSQQTYDVVTADLNGDHHLDLVAVGTATNGLAVLLGNGDGTFKPPVTYPVTGAFAVVVGDFNGDGIPDLATDNLEQNSVSILLGKGDGTFNPPVTISLGNNDPYWITSGDFNGDGKLDLVVVNAGNPGTVGILLGNGDGTFQPMLVGPNVGAYPIFVTAADLNGDGKLDLVVTDQPEAADNVQVVLGNGDGTFQPAVAYTGGHAPQSAAVADFNGDGLPDIALANAGPSGYTGSVVLFTGTGGGAFKLEASAGAGSNPYFVIAADFNGDGKPDLAVANIDGNNVSILLNTGP